MIFKPELAEKVLRGEKTVTRRPRDGGMVGDTWVDDPCRYKVGKTYAVQPGRGKRAIGRILVNSIEPERMCDMREGDELREGFATRAEFEAAWLAMYGKGSWLDLVWRIEFELVQHGARVVRVRVDLRGSKLGPGWNAVDVDLDGEVADWPTRRIREEAARYYDVPLEQVGEPRAAAA